jgi:hypothetical protein
VLAVRGQDSSGRFLVNELVIPGRASVGSPRTKNPPDGNKSRIPYSEGSLPHKHNFLKFKHENVIKMKNKPGLALLRPSNLSNEIKKGYHNLVRLSLLSGNLQAKTAILLEIVSFITVQYNMTMNAFPCC